MKIKTPFGWNKFWPNACVTIKSSACWTWPYTSSHDENEEKEGRPSSRKREWRKHLSWHKTPQNICMDGENSLKSVDGPKVWLQLQKVVRERKCTDSFGNPDQKKTLTFTKVRNESTNMTRILFLPTLWHSSPMEYCMSLHIFHRSTIDYCSE